MKKCELLVPVGGEKQLIAAVENGADAVYLGGKAFNARINAGNFDEEEMKAAVDFAHKRGVKVFVTMNTLIKNEEMQDALDYVYGLYNMGVDALIVQDLGLGKLVRENFPDFPLHLSTQGSVYDLRGVEAAYHLGYERVVLARELSMEEIAHICQNTQAEIEVFVHGALCICYSGQCQMSRNFGGRSGNRGQCAQPCRLPYKSFDKDGRLLKTFPYPLSPKDLCMIDHLDELAEAGVTSLKIEGRMKSPEYVAIVTSIYRKYLDEYEAKGTYAVSDEDREALEQIFNRGGFTEGYYDHNPGRNLMSGNIPKHRGIKIGKVVKKIQGGSLIDVKLYRTLSLGDGVEIQGENVTGNVVTYYKELKSGLTRIGDIKGAVAHGDPLYRITSKAQLEDARRTFENKTYAEGKFLRKTPVDMVFGCDHEGQLMLEVRSGLLDAPVKVLSEPHTFEEGRRMDLGRIEKALSKTGNTPFAVNAIEIGELSEKNIPISLINDIRRQALSKLEDALCWRRKAAGRPRCFYVPRTKSASALEFYFYDWESFSQYQMPEALRELDVDKAALIPLIDYVRHYDEIGEGRMVIPYITSISKGKENDFVEKHFDEICEKVKDVGVYVGNLSWVQPFRSAGVRVYGDYGLNVYNDFAEEAYATIGVRHCVQSLEAVERGFGSMPLMISEHWPEAESFVDRRKERLRLLKRDFSDQILLISDQQNLDFEVIEEALSGSSAVVRIYLK